MTFLAGVSRSRPSARLMLCAACVGACLLLCLPLAGVASASSAAKKGSPSAAIVAAAKKATADETSVHCVIAAYDSSTKQTTKVTEDAGLTRGLETLAVGTAQVKLRLTSSAAFLSGNNKGLSLVFGLTTTQIAQVGGKWLFAKSGTSQYADVKAAVTITPLLQSVLPTTSKVKLAQAKLNGKAVKVLTWSTTSQKETVRLVLDIAAKGPSLPIQLTAVNGKNHETALFSDWGEKIAVPVPSSTVELSS